MRERDWTTWSIAMECVANSDRNEITIRHNTAKPIWNSSFRGNETNSTCVCAFRSFGMGQKWSRWAWASEPFKPFHMSSRRVWFMSLNLSISIALSLSLLLVSSCFFSGAWWFICYFSCSHLRLALLHEFQGFLNLTFPTVSIVDFTQPAPHTTHHYVKYMHLQTVPNIHVVWTVFIWVWIVIMIMIRPTVINSNWNVEANAEFCPNICIACLEE